MRVVRCSISLTKNPSYDPNDKFFELDSYSTDHRQLLFQRVANTAVGVELRPTTVMPSNALSKLGGYVVTGLEAVDESMSKHVTAKLKWF